MAYRRYRRVRKRYNPRYKKKFIKKTFKRKRKTFSKRKRNIVINRSLQKAQCHSIRVRLSPSDIYESWNYNSVVDEGFTGADIKKYCQEVTVQI